MNKSQGRAFNTQGSCAVWNNRFRGWCQYSQKCDSWIGTGSLSRQNGSAWLSCPKRDELKLSVFPGRDTFPHSDVHGPWKPFLASSHVVCEVLWICCTLAIPSCCKDLGTEVICWRLPCAATDSSRDVGSCSPLPGDICVPQQGGNPAHSKMLWKY